MLSEYELKHLHKLATAASFPYRKHRSFEQELRHLRALGFIENKPGKTISSMPEKGDLRDYLVITDYGREYLKKREQLET